ncbi:MAG: c-type cytochrome [Betaproteobacteria bacterium]|nr:MAG: c-type cytochrome [Betaproteobacteria bacterium]
MSLTTRTLLCAALLGVVAVPAQAADKKRDAAMLELAERHRCLNCHEVDVKVRGPAWREVGRRYRDDPEAEVRLLVKVREGGSGVWGDDFMSPNKRVSDADLQALVRWILSLR